MSLLLFLVNLEGLSRMILKAKHDGYIKGIKTTRLLSIIELLFVYNVVLFGNGSLEE